MSDSTSYVEAQLINYKSARIFNYGSNDGRNSAECDSDDLNHLHLAAHQYTEVPQGRHLGIFSTMVLFVSRILGSGIFTTPGDIFVNCGGNVYLFLGVWVATSILGLCGLFIFLEFGMWLPRSGGRKLFLEHTYTSPKLMMSITFGVFTILSGLALSGSVIFGKYLLIVTGLDIKYTKLLSIGLVASVIFSHGYSVRFGILIQNLLGGLKLLLAVLIVSTGLYGLIYYDSAVLNPEDMLIDGQYEHKLPLTLSSFASALISAFFSFSGWDSVHAVASEVENPSRTLPIAGYLSLFVCTTCYMVMNFAYLKVLSFQEITTSGPMIGSVFFQKLFGPVFGRKVLSLIIALSAASNVFVTTYGVSRMNQEVFREGYIPFSDILARNWPSGSPFLSLLICGILTIFWILILPTEGASFQYLVSLDGYGNHFFLALIAVGLLVFRHKNRETYQKPSIKAPTLGIFSLASVCIYMLIAPFTASDTESMKVGGLPPYHIMSLLIILFCFGFWYFKFNIAPKVGKYKLVPELRKLPDDLVITVWRKHAI